MKKYNRRGIAALLGGTLIAATISVPATAEAATAPTEVKTIRGDNYFDYATDQPTIGGTTGFLHQRLPGTPWLWTRYSDRHTTVVSVLAGRNVSSIHPAGGDTVFLNGSTLRQTLDLSTMTLRRVPALTGTPFGVRVFGDSVLALYFDGTNFTAELSQITADGSRTPTPILGMPDGPHQIIVMAGDATTAVLRFAGSDGVQLGLLDVASGKMTMLDRANAASRVVLAGDRLGLLTSSQVRTFSRTGIVDGTDTEPDVFTLPAGTPTDRMALAGEDLIVGPPSSPRGPALRYRPDGTAPTTVLPEAATPVLQAADGALLVGGTGREDWSVRKVTSTGQSVVLPLHQQVNAGVTLSSGVLRHIQALVRPGEAPLYNHYGFELLPDAADHAPWAANGTMLSPSPCEPDAVCVRTVDGSQQGTSYIGTSNSRRRMMTTIGSGNSIGIFPSDDGTLVDAAPGYRIINGTNPDQQYIMDSSSSTPLVTRPVTGAGLWFSILWSASRAGYLQSKDLSTGTLGAEIPIGSACAATEIQATANHLYWSCGRSGPSGVYVIATKKNISLPGGQYLLGDNYVVRHDTDGTLLRYDLTGGTLGEPATLATFARAGLADDRNITWAVDKFGGDVAWVDSENTTHIVDPGVTPSPLAAYPDEPAFDLDYYTSLSKSVPLTRPVSGTTLAIKELRTGAVVSSSGGAARFGARASWDGTIAGKPATRGTYQWSLSATVNGATTKLVGGTVNLHCVGAPPLHSYDCSGRPNLLGLTSAATGAGQWLAVNPGGAGLVRLAWQDEMLTPVTAVVPFGDVTKDLRNDLLIRRSNGSLLSFRGGDGLPFTGRSLIAIPGNWNRWDALIHTGDLTGDGQSDLIARDRATGGLYRIDGNGQGGFKSPVLWATGYKGYTRFVGPGDINGDGKADLILFVGTNMYAKYGDGKGGLGDRRLVGSGFLGYNAIVGAGDLNEDGKNDLLLRDTAGNLYRRLGDGKGNFGNRLLVGVGYQKFASIY